ncbi:MAG: 4Fe-4S ferredoxin, partial [Nitrospirae bacterium]|nr:4Fe-4S ferredoxin [Nitrospirota bacterium]
TVIPFLDNADLLVAADCTAFAVPGFQERFLKDKKLLIGCPKLDNAQAYIEKFTEIFSTIPIKSVSCLRMEVPCCGGMTAILKEAINKSGKDIPFAETIIGVKGDVLREKTL